MTSRWGIYNQSQADVAAIESNLDVVFGCFTYETHLTGAAKAFPGANADQALARGALLSVGINPYEVVSGTKKAIDGGNAAVGAGRYDAAIEEWAAKLGAYQHAGGLVHALYHLEPLVKNAAQPDAGSAADFKAAFERVRAILSSAGILVGWDMTAADWNNGKAQEWEPDVYDILSVDGYAKKSGKTAEITFAGFVAGAIERPGKPTFIRSTTPEFGDAEQAQWVHDASAIWLDLNVLGVGWDLENCQLRTTPKNVPLTVAAFKEEADRWAEVVTPPDDDCADELAAANALIGTLQGEKAAAEDARDSALRALSDFRAEVTTTIEVVTDALSQLRG